MHTVNTLRRVLGLTCLSLLLVTSMGCNKLLAKYYVSRAQKKVEQSKENKAEKFTPELLEQTNTAINTAQSQIGMQNFKDAATSGKEAARISKELLQRTKTLYATYLKDQAYKWIDIAKTNQAQTENNELFTQIQADNESGLKLMEKQKYDKSIVVFTKAIADIQYLLRNLETKAKDGLAEAKQMKEDLIKEGAKEHAPEYVEELTQFIDKIKNQIEKENNYRAALSTRDQARQRKQEGIQQTKMVKSKKQLAEIENLLNVAVNLEAEMYAMQNFRIISKEFETLLTQHYEKKYDTVLAAAPELKPRVESLIVETKRESARAKMKAVEKAINTLVDGKARNYLPGRVEQLDSLLKEARELFDQGEKQGIKERDFFTESKTVSNRGLEVDQNIIQEFDALAQKEINKAKESLSSGEGVYRTMESIFDRPAPGLLTGDDKALEDSKHALKEELKAKLNNARLSLGLASLKREEKDFDLSIETAKQVAQTSDEVAQQTYRVVAHNAILEIANELTRFEREGGRQYAQAETDKTLDLLEQSKDLLHKKEYRDAVRRAADTKAQLSILNQELERVAIKKIDQAQKALSQAKDDRAEKYQNDTFTQAIVSLDRAKASLEGEGLQQAIESARQAQDLASDASEKSLLQWTREEIQRGDILIGEARKAGADQYAPERLQKATDLRKNLQQLYEQKAYKEAIGVGEQTVEAANGALYAKVIEAENEIARAKRSEGWQHEPKQLADAIISAKNAREMIDKGQYQIGLQHAQNALTVSSRVSRDAKREAFETRMGSLQKHLETAQSLGAGYYQGKDLSKMLSEMNRLRNEFAGQSYEDLAPQIEKLEAQLAGVMEMTPDVLKELVTAMQNRLRELENRGAKTVMADKVEEVERKIKYAQLDYKAEKFRPSFQNAKDASKLLDAIGQNLDEREFDAALSQQIKAFSVQVEKFGPVLDMGSPAMIEMSVGPLGKAQATTMMRASSPSDLRTAITEIGAKVQSMPTPPSRVNVRDAAVKMLIVAKTSAANFEKMLILDQYDRDEAKKIIQTAFLQMYQARTQQQEIQRTLQYPNSEAEPKGVERIVTYQGS